MYYIYNVGLYDSIYQFIKESKEYKDLNLSNKSDITYVISVAYDNFLDEVCRTIVKLKVSDYTYNDISKEVDINSTYVGQKFRHSINIITKYIYKYNKGEFDISSDNSFLNLEDFEYKGTFRCLINAGYTRLTDLTGIDYNKFIKIRGAGNKYWEDCKKVMDRNCIPYERCDYDSAMVKERFLEVVRGIDKKYNININTLDMELIEDKIDSINTIMKYLYEIEKVFE